MSKRNYKKRRNPHWPSFARELKRHANKIAEEGKKDFVPLIKKTEAMEEPYYKAQALAWIARRMGNAGTDSSSVFRESIKVAGLVEQEWRRAEILNLIIEEMSKAGEREITSLIDTIVGFSDPIQREKVLSTLKRRMNLSNGDFTIITNKLKNEGRFFKKKSPVFNSPPSKGSTEMKSNITLGLFNTYSGSTMKDAHIRVVARAAPLCYAFNLNLCLFEFPVKDAASLTSMVEKGTQIGDGQGYIEMLFEEGRLFVLDSPKNPVHPKLGMIVAVTSNPDHEKRTELKALFGKRPFCAVMGLGSSGLPKNILKLSKYHLELTGRNITLETCTAMGILASKLDLSGIE